MNIAILVILSAILVGIIAIYFLLRKIFKYISATLDILIDSHNELWRMHKSIVNKKVK